MKNLYRIVAISQGDIFQWYEIEMRELFCWGKPDSFALCKIFTSIEEAEMEFEAFVKRKNKPPFTKKVVKVLGRA